MRYVVYPWWFYGTVAFWIRIMKAWGIPIENARRQAWKR
jgi:hypothetical protein